MDLLKFLGYELPKQTSEEVKLDDAQRHFTDLERAIDNAVKACGYSNDDYLIDEVDTINSERNWANDYVYSLIEAYSNHESQIYELEALLDYLVDEVHSRMTEEEIKEFEQAQIMAKLKAKEST
mgnify:CR=1 FL=1